jgi:hypothetical protein
MLSAAKHLHYRIATKQIQILRFAPDDTDEGFSRGLLMRRNGEMNPPPHGEIHSPPRTAWSSHL